MDHITVPTSPPCLNIVIYVKLSQPQKEHLELTMLIWFGLFVFKGLCLKTHQLLNSEYQSRVLVCKNSSGGATPLELLLFSLSLAGYASQMCFKKSASLGLRKVNCLLDQHACAVTLREGFLGQQDFTLLKRPLGSFKLSPPRRPVWGFSLQSKGLSPYQFFSNISRDKITRESVERFP